MTTIAYRDGVLAADTLVTSGNGARVGHVEKIGRGPDGSLWGFSGNPTFMAKCAQWVAAGGEGDPPRAEESVFVHVSADGLVREWWGDGWVQYAADYFAWGSGGRIALGAMAAGADAVRAVEIGAALDSESMGPVSVERLG